MQPTTITGVRTIGVKVSDQDAATEFYVAALGFEKRLDAPISPTMRWIEVAPPGATTSIALNLNDGDPGVYVGHRRPFHGAQCGDRAGRDA
jgi:catechol 2,3-dioxygenase-like lactoylglutathione lyase family enzyme